MPLNIYNLSKDTEDIVSFFFFFKLSLRDRNDHNIRTHSLSYVYRYIVYNTSVD